MPALSSFVGLNGSSLCESEGDNPSTGFVWMQNAANARETSDFKLDGIKLEL